ncbi:MULTISPECIES: hypothetical protein [Stenotrophomonas]|uniref:hypothetical protein n=1 Tax=Stenotrophomonas TaxID=40323 RepID=UPI00066B9F4A|nr:MULTISPECIES: hypothetical protein [Stenotrophomonas]MRI44306.1 hypothetical protein [Stenotrophomonas sp. MH181796]
MGMAAAGWLSYVTFALALFGAGLSVFNTVIQYRRGAIRWRVVPAVKMAKDGRLELWVDLVNTGRIAVPIEKVALACGRKLQPLSDVLNDRNGHPGFPLELGPGKKRTIGPVYAHTLSEVAMKQPTTVVAYAEDGRRVQARCPALRQLYVQLQSAQAEHAAKPVRNADQPGD